jgi:hypothetical protein
VASGRWLALGTSAVAVGLGGLWVLCAGGPSPAAAADAAPGFAGAGPGAEVMGARIVPEAAVAPAPRAAAEPAAAAAPEPAPAAPADGAQRFEAHLAAVMAGETDDRAWSGKMVARIDASFHGGGAFAGSHVKSAVCKRTLCRVEIVHDDEAAHEHFLDAVTGTPPFDSQGFVRPSPSGGTLVYLAREGTRLPRLE